MNREKPMRAFFLATGALSAAYVLPGHAAEASRDLADALALEPPSWEFDNTTIRLGGVAAGALFTAHQSSGFDHTGATSVAQANIQGQRIFDNGMVLGARSDFLVFRDTQSGDNYNNDTVEKIYVFAQTGFGRVEIGQQDGAAYTLSLFDPITNQQDTLVNFNISLFLDPPTADEFRPLFQSITQALNTPDL